MNERVGFPIFTYHSLDSSGSITSTEPARFLDTMERLVSAGLRCVGLEDWLDSGRPPLPRTFAIAFDDGDASILHVADEFPRLGLTATLFVVARHVGGHSDWRNRPRWVPISKLLDWSELSELAERGFAVGSHTSTHVDLTRVDRRLLDEELRESKSTIEDRLGRPCRMLAHPYGKANSTVRHAAARHYRSAVGTRLAEAGQWDDAFDIPRIDSYYLAHTSLTDRLIEGTAERWLRWRGRLRTARSAARWGRVG